MQDSNLVIVESKMLNLRAPFRILFLRFLFVQIQNPTSNYHPAAVGVHTYIHAHASIKDEEKCAKLQMLHFEVLGNSTSFFRIRSIKT